MPSFTALDIVGYRDRPVPNTFIRQDNEHGQLAIILPGYGYRAEMPVLYYPERLLIKQGADVLRVAYAYDRQAEFAHLEEVEKNRWLFTDVEAALSSGLNQGTYRKVILVGKSIGTRAMGHLLETGMLPAETRCVWLTPILRNDMLQAQIKRIRPRSLFAIGTADPHYDPTRLCDAENATGGRSVVIEGADHSLEIGDDLIASIKAMAKVIQAIEQFLN